MSITAVAALVLIGGFFLLLFLKVPVSFSMLLATLASAAVYGINFSDMVNQMVAGVKSFSLLAIPFFILMGEFMGAGGISDKIIDFANLLVGRFRAGSRTSTAWTRCSSAACPARRSPT